MTDWMWVYENPKEAAARIEALEAALREIATECSTFPIKDGLAFRCESIAYTALATETEK